MARVKKLVGVFVALALVVAGFSCSYAQTPAQKKALFLIAADKFQDDEYAVPKQVLENSGVKVTVASTTLEEITGMNGAQAKADILLKDAAAKDYDAVVFIGGSGAAQYLDDAAAQALAKEAVSQNKIVGAICIAPLILTNAGVLKDKTATCYPSEGEKMKSAGVNYTAGKVEKDGLIITADGPSSAKEFGEALAQALAAK